MRGLYGNPTSVGGPPPAAFTQVEETMRGEGARGLGGVARQGGPRRAALRGRGAPARSPAHGQRPAFVVVTIVPATRWNDFRSRFFRVPFQAGALVALLGDG